MRRWKHDKNFERIFLENVFFGGKVTYIRVAQLKNFFLFFLIFKFILFIFIKKNYMLKQANLEMAYRNYTKNEISLNNKKINLL